MEFGNSDFEVRKQLANNPSNSKLEIPNSKSGEAACPHCKGVGWLRMDVRVGDPRFGKLYPCVCRTNATEERNLEELYKLSNLEAFWQKDFSNFDYEIAGTEDAYRAAQKFAKEPEGWLVLMGGYGSGKTHLAAAIANYVVQEHRMQVYFAVAPDLLHHLRAAFAPNSATTYDDRFEQIRSVPLLVIDDLGAEQTTPWAAEKLYQIFNHRYNNQFPTVVTSNCDLDSLDPRIRSRLCDPDLCDHYFLSCGDYRMRKLDPRFVQGARNQGQGTGGPRPQGGQRGNSGYRRNGG